jgi:hypothetical protein
MGANCQSNRRAELAPQNKNLCKIVTFHMSMVQCKSVTIWVVSDLRAYPWPPKKNKLFVTIFQCGKAIFLGGQGGAERMCEIASCNSQMSGTYFQKPYPHIKKVHTKRWCWKRTKKIVIAGCVTLYSGAKIALFHFAKHFRMSFWNLKYVCIANDTWGFS